MNQSRQCQYDIYRNMLIANDVALAKKEFPIMKTSRNLFHSTVIF